MTETEFWMDGYDNLADGAVRTLSQMRTYVQRVANAVDEAQRASTLAYTRLSATNHQYETMAEALNFIASSSCERSVFSRCWEDGRPRGNKDSAYSDRWCFPCIALAALNPDMVTAKNVSEEAVAEAPLEQAKQFSKTDPETWQLGQAVWYRRNTASPWMGGTYLGVDDDGAHQIADHAGDIKLFTEVAAPLVQARREPPNRVKM